MVDVSPPVSRIALQIDTSTGFSTQLIRGIADYMQEHQRWELLVQTRGTRERWRIPRHWKPDGVIARITQRAQARELQKLGVPVVNVSRSTVSGYDFPQVTIDDRQLGLWAADHFLERGLRHFGYFGLLTQSCYVDRCGPAFHERLAEQGFACSNFGAYSAGGRAQAEPTIAAVRQWVCSLPAPLGIFVSGIDDAHMLNDACWSSNRHVPESVAILCGEDDPLLSTISNPSLSCIDPDPHRVGYEAAAALDLLLKGQALASPVQRVPPARVVARRSTETVAFEDSDLAKALRFIRDSATLPIDVSDVLQNVPVSRRVLEQRFARALGRSPAAEIRRVRLERAKSLLMETDWKMPRVAEASGFSSNEVMSQVFRRELECTPTEYRDTSRRVVR